MGKVGSRSRPPHLPSTHGGAGLSVWLRLPLHFSRGPRGPSFPAGLSVPLCSSPFLHVLSLLYTFSALGGNSGVPVPPTQWTGRGRGTLEVGFPSSTSGSSSSDHPLLLALGVVVLDGQTGLLEWGSLCVRGMWVRSRREIVTPAPGTHPRTFSICPTPPPFHCTLNSN